MIHGRPQGRDLDLGLFMAAALDGDSGRLQRCALKCVQRLRFSLHALRSRHTVLAINSLFLKRSQDLARTSARLLTSAKEKSINK